MTSTAIILVLIIFAVAYLLLSGRLPLILTLVLPRLNHPDIPNLREGQDDSLYLESLTRGVLVVGRPGSGKTVWLAMQTMIRALANPDCPIFVLDASGSFCDEFIKLTYQLSQGLREQIESRMIFDRMGDPKYVTAFPFFSDEYGLDVETQVMRVTENWKKLQDELVKVNPTMGGIPLGELAPQTYRMLCAIRFKDGSSGQITEAKKLLMNETWLYEACKKFGKDAPEAKWYFERQFLSLTEPERDLRSYTLRSILGAVEPKAIRARVGYHTPGWTPREAIEKGQIVLVSGEELINQEQAMGILFTDVYSQILAVINERTPHDPTDPPVLMVIDEVPMLLEIKGMAEEIGKVSPRYRSRRLQIIVIIQMLAQLDDDLRKKIWSLGNTACFGIDSHKEAYEIAQQLFNYDPQKIKFAATSDTGQPIVEQDRGGYLIGANWLQHLPARSLVLKRWIDEGTEERFVQFIQSTSDKPDGPLPTELIEIKEQLLERTAIPIEEALKAVNSRTLKTENQPPTVG